MFEIIPVFTGSKGNAYIIRNSNTTVLIECGKSLEKICKKSKVYDFNFALISHEHKDHAGHINDLLNLSIPVYMTNGTANALNVNCNTFEKNQNNTYKKTVINTMEITPIKTNHDAVEPVGFYIESLTNKYDNLFFMTDMASIDTKIDNCKYYMLECNYTDEMINRALIGGDNKEKIKRIKQTHMSLKNLETYIKSLNLKYTESIYILHLSDNNSDERVIKETLQKATGVPIIIV